MLVITNNGSMPDSPKTRRPSPAPPILEEEAYTALLRTADQLQTRFACWLRPHNLSPTQYNALRILRGAGPEGLPCSQIGERMLTHDPDITRLVDRLAKRGWVARSRDSRDRRVVRARITKQGLALLAELDRPLRDFVRELLAPACAEHLRSLLKTCEALTAPAHPSQEAESSTPP
jgi:DNA-binding MarR family transcriptional regulator